MDSKSGAIEIFVFHGTRFLGSRCYSHGPISIGSSPESTLRLNDPSVEEKQAIVRIGGRDLFLVNNGQPESVLVNGNPVRLQAVTSLDDISIGPFRLKVSVLSVQQQGTGFGAQPVQHAPVQGTTPPVSTQDATPPTFEAEDETVPGLVSRTALGSIQLDRAPDTVEMALAEIEQSQTDDEKGYGFDDDEEDEEEDEDFVEPFSLLENVAKERFKDPTETESFKIVEVIRYFQTEILDLLRANPGKSVRVPPDNFKLINVYGDGQAKLFCHKDFTGTLVRKGKAYQLEDLFSSENATKSRKGIHTISLETGDYAQIKRDNIGYLVRFVQPPKVPKPKFEFQFGLKKLQIFAGSAAFHLLILALLGFITPEKYLRDDSETERFAKVALKDLQLEKKKEEEPQKEEPPPKQKDKIKIDQKHIKAALARQKKRQVAKVLTALKKFDVGGSPARSNLKSLTNIAAVRSPTRSAFTLTGTLKKLPGNEVRLATASPGKDTKVGSQLLSGTDLGAVAARAGTGSMVRGRV
ncbi:MAG: FHA domain-containing protein, partial [Pseudomonadota bacterium]